MKVPFAILLFVPLLLLQLNLQLLAQQLTFNKVSSPFGSFSGLVGGIAQDKNGFMWITANSGLYRYDGHRFKKYNHDPSNTNTISSQHLEMAYADRKGIIWIATYVNGLDRLDPVTGVFTHFKHNENDPKSLSSDTVRTILEDRDGTLWIGTNRGLDRFDPKTGKFQVYHHDINDPYSLSCDQVRKIYEDKQGTLWVGTGSVWPGEGGETDEGGLNRFDKKTGKFIRYLHDPNNPHSLINNKVQAICEDSRGTFWVGTAGDGLHTMNRATELFDRHQHDSVHPEKLSRPEVRNGREIPDHITFISEDALGSIWIGTKANGINRYDPITQKTVHYGKDTALGFIDNSGWTFCNSRDGVLWISTWEGGLYRIDPYHQNMAHVVTGSPVIAFNEDRENNLWIGTAEGLIVKNRETGTSKKFRNEVSNKNSLSNNTVTRIFRDPGGAMWVGTVNGLNRFNASSNSFTQYRNDPKDTSSISPGTIFTIAEAGDDSLWIGTINGLDLMSKRTGNFRHFKNNPKDSNSLTRDYITALLGDKAGNLWVGTNLDGGLNYFDRRSRTFKSFLKNKTVYSLFRDSNGSLLVGTDGEGIYRTSNPSNGFTQFRDPGSSIENTSVGSIKEDNQKNVWISTPSGIYKINLRNDQATLYSTNYGVNPDNLYTLSCFRGANGEIYFGEQNGYYVITPEKRISNPIPPQVVFTDFRLSDKLVLPGEHSPLDEPIESSKSISLSHDQNVFSVEIAVIHYTNPNQNRLLYKLENYDINWREVGAEKMAYYYNVPPGHYIFKVKATSSTGVKTEKELTITINPPWWKTWWACCLYGLLLIVGIYTIHRIQKQRVIAAEREKAQVRELAQAKEIEKAYKELEVKSAQLEEQKEELQATIKNLKSTQTQLIQSEKMASLGELTAGIAHEIQNPLNFVNNFSEVNIELIEELKSGKSKVKSERDELLEDELLNEIAENEQKINHHGKRADAIVKGMLQHSRTNTGKKELTDINTLVDEYFRLSYHGLRAKDKSFNATLQTDLDETIGKIEVVPQDIGRVLLNLFNNAFYAVNEKKRALTSKGENYEPTVWVSTKRSLSSGEGRGEVIISVKDNGFGIPQKAVDKIFQPFFTTKPTGQGTGLGLSLSYDIIKAHGGEIKVHSRDGEGSAFFIQLPVNLNPGI